MICQQRFPDRTWPCVLPAGHDGYHRAGVFAGHVRWGGGTEVADDHTWSEGEQS